MRLGSNVLRSMLLTTLLLSLILPSTIASSAASPSSEPIRLAFAGDILLDGFVGDQIAKYGVNFPFVKVAPTLQRQISPSRIWKRQCLFEGRQQRKPLPLGPNQQCSVA